MTEPDEVMLLLEQDGYAVVPERLGETVLAAARDELGELLAAADWGSGFDGSRARKVWALLAKIRCMDQAALDPLVLDAVERAIEPGAQFGLTYAPRREAGPAAAPFWRRPGCGKRQVSEKTGAGNAARWSMMGWGQAGRR
jgi:hypothetical protein